ncbi:MAG: helix-turn-helix transcriptional regulator [Bacteroidota bacterium]
MRISSKGKYYGAKQVELALQKIVLSQYDYVTEGTPWHYHENPYFMFVLSGNMLDCNKKGQSLLPAGSLMFNNWQEQHYGRRYSPAASGFHLEFERSWLKKHDFDLDIFEGSQKIDDPHVQFLVSKVYFEFLLADEYSELSTDLLLLQICDALRVKKEGDKRGIPSWVTQLKELLHDDSSDITLQGLSKEIGVHPVHISRAAPKYLSVSLGEYIRKIKLSKATSALLDSTMSLTEIAYHAGFSDQSHFNHVFKTYYKVNPGSFRKKVKQSARG